MTDDSNAVELATGDIERIERLHGCGDSLFLTCPERDGGCAYNHGPDRPDDYELVFLLDFPFCPTCGCSLVIVPRGTYDGPAHKFRSLDEPGESLA